MAMPTLHGACAVVLSIALCACGGGSTSATAPEVPEPPASGRGVFLIEGSAAGAGWVDGQGAGAQFFWRGRIVPDNSGNVLVADGVAIRKVTASGAVSTVYAAPFNGESTAGISSVAEGPDGSVYFVDVAALRKLGTDGSVTTLFSMPAGTFLWNASVAVDGSGNVYLVHQSTILRITGPGQYTLVAGAFFDNGTADGTGEAARFRAPRDLTADAAGNLYVIDNQGQGPLRKITAAGVVSTLALSVTGAEGLAADTAGNLYVGGTFGLRILAPDGAVRTLAWSGDAPVQQPGGSQDYAVDPGGRIYIKDGYRMLRAEPSGAVSVLAAVETGRRTADQFRVGEVLAPAPGGDVFAVQRSTAGAVSAVLRITPEGGTSTAWTVPAAWRGGAFVPGGFATDPQGNAYIAERPHGEGGDAVTGGGAIHRLSADGGIALLAGKSGTPGVADGSGADARFRARIAGLAFAGGTLYVLDGNWVRKVSPAGVVSTLVTAITDNWKGFAHRGIAADAQGNVYVYADDNTVRKISAGGAVSVLARDVAQGLSGWMGIDSVIPRGITMGVDGNLYVGAGATVRKITPAGVVSTAAGDVDRPGTRLGPLPGQLPVVQGLAFFDARTLAISTDGATLKVVLP